MIVEDVSDDLTGLIVILDWVALINSYDVFVDDDDDDDDDACG